MVLNGYKLVESFLTYKSLTPAIDQSAINNADNAERQAWPIDIPSSVVRMLMVRRSSIRLHLGVLAIALELDKPFGPPQYEAMQRLADNGIDHNKLSNSIRYIRSLGVVKAMRSRPWIGRSFKKRCLTSK